MYYTSRQSMVTQRLFKFLEYIEKRINRMTEIVHHGRVFTRISVELVEGR